MNHSLFFKVSIIISGLLLCSVVEAMAGELEDHSSQAPFSVSAR